MPINTLAKMETFYFLNACLYSKHGEFSYRQLNVKMEALSCFNCAQPFVGKGKNKMVRYRMANYTSPSTFRKLYPEGKGDLGTSFVCAPCLADLRKRTLPKKKNSNFRKVKEDVASASSTCPTQPEVEEAIDAFRLGKFKQGISMLTKLKAAKDAVVEVCCQFLKTEISKVKKKTGPFSEEFTLDTLKAFSWGKALAHFDAEAPVAGSFLRALFPTPRSIMTMRMLGPRHRKRPQTLEEAEAVIDTRLGMVISILLHTCRPRKFKFTQTVLGVQMWTQGATETLFSTLQSLGVSQSAQPARGHVDRLNASHDQEIIGWREAMENPTQPTVARKIIPETTAPGFSVCWDNVQIEKRAKHQSTDHQSQFLIWGMCFGVSHRVGAGHSAGQRQMEAGEIGAAAFLPTADDFQNLREHMAVMVDRILVVHLPALQHLASKLPRIRHEYSDEMEKKSSVVNIGVVDANPSSTPGVTTIMEHLHSYVPLWPDGEVQPILCHGDGMSNERMHGSLHSRANEETPEQRLEGLIPTPQEFHKEMLLLQDTINALFSPGSDTCVGSMAFLKQRFRHRNFKKEVKDNFQHAWDMMEFSMEAYVVLAALTELGMASIEELPPLFPDGGHDDDKLAWLHGLSHRLVNFAWQQPKNEDIFLAGEVYERSRVDQSSGETAEIFPYCNCLEDKDEVMVRCCSNNCRGRWFHLSCVDLQDPPGPDEEWYCSPECDTNGTTIYCFCHTRQGGEMVQCHHGELCTQHEWYHRQCLIVAEGPLPDPWYCSPECREASDNNDEVQEYAKRVMFLGLNHLVRRDAVREGNGPAILSHWRLDMPHFWKFRHWKYFIMGHYLLTATAGFHEERIAFDMTWNRLGNVSGNARSNVGLDLVNEFVNNEFKEMLRRSRGRYTPKQVSRCAQMGSEFRKSFLRNVAADDLGTFRENRRRASVLNHRYQTDVATFCCESLEEGLCCRFPGRSMARAPAPVTEMSSEATVKMGEKLGELSCSLDMWRRVSHL